MVAILRSYLYVLNYLAGLQLHIAYMLLSANYYFYLLYFGVAKATCCSYGPIALNLNARTTQITHSG